MSSQSAPKKRKYRFPVAPITEAIHYLPALAALEDEGKLDRNTMATALGFEALNEPALQGLGAFFAYHMVEPKPSGKLALTALSKKMLQNESDLEALRIAALSPLLFRFFWKSLRQISLEELTQLLISKGLSEEDAAKAVEVHSTNAELAKLDEVTEEPAGLPEPKINARSAAQRARRAEKKAQKNMLKLPLKNGAMMIPREISEEEYELIQKTLTLWKDQIVKPENSLPAEAATL